MPPQVVTTPFRLLPPQVIIMSFRAFNKNLSEEIENLFASLGDSCLPEEAHRLDDNTGVSSVDIQELLRRVQNLDVDCVDPASAQDKPNSQD